MSSEKRTSLSEYLDVRSKDILKLYYLDVGHPNALTFLQKSVEELENHKKSVIALNGLPLSGKTWTRENLLEPSIRQAHVNITITTLHWDLIEDTLTKEVLPQARQTYKKGKAFPQKFQKLVNASLKKRGVSEGDRNYQGYSREKAEKYLNIQIEPGKLYPLEMLEAVSLYMEIELKRHLESTGHEIIILDKPAGTGLRADSSLRHDLFAYERNYATNIMENLARRKGVFEDLRQKKIFTGYLGLVPGPKMDALMRIELRDLYKKVQPQITGGSVEQADNLRIIAAWLVRDLIQNPNFSLPEEVIRLVHLGDKLAVGKQKAKEGIEELKNMVSAPLGDIISETQRNATFANLEEQLPGYLSQIGVNLATGLIMLDECQNFCDEVGIFYYNPPIDLGILKETINSYRSKILKSSQAPADPDLAQ